MSYFNYDDCFAGMAVAYSAPTRHGCLKVVENNFCASRRGIISSISTVFSSATFSNFGGSYT